MNIRFLTLFALLLWVFFPVQSLSAEEEVLPQRILAFIDVETTGLIPGYHEMIDIGMIYTDVEGNEIDRLFYRVNPDYPERCQDGARAVNGYDEERWKALNAISKKELVDNIIEFHNKNVKNDEQVLLVAYNCQFDTAFLDFLFRDVVKSWRNLYHYYVLDLPSMAWQKGFYGLTGSSLSKALGIEEETHNPLEHTGITGTEFNVSVYRALQKL